MEPSPDYRSDKMESREGRGLAQERRRRWEESIPNDVWDIVGNGGRSLESVLGTERANEFRQQLSEEAKERSEMMGFWLSWHLAGGFAGLESAGWNRATLFRKVALFRTTFDAHPDEYSFPFLKLDPEASWMNELLDELGYQREPEEQ